jgi:fido (protein-threonine AMPylation protein)
VTAEPDGATPLDPDEREGLRLRHVQTRGELDRLEQANIVDGLRWLSRQKKPEVLSEAFVYRLHKELFGQVWRWAGQRRQTEKNIGVAPHQIDVQPLRQADAHNAEPLLKLFGGETLRR